jgi:hypothetical protein
MDRVREGQRHYILLYFERGLVILCPPLEGDIMVIHNKQG